ncbi:MAG TPA: YtxH domain-containing protein [Streptosporangiaceae bacterium]
MKYRATFIAGAALGYVLGTKAGRERYEQIKRASRWISENPTVQETAGLIRAQAGELAGNARSKVNETVGDKIPGLRRSGDDDGSRRSANESTPSPN